MRGIGLFHSLCISVLLVAASQAKAHTDYGVTTLFRTYSPGLSINPTIGYNQKVWGDSSTPWYGFVRPYALGVISPSVFEAKGGIEIYPISILGFDLRRAYGRRFKDTSNQNCEILECQGALPYTDVSIQSFLGYGDYFASIRFTRTFFDGDQTRSYPVYELGSAVLLGQQGDHGDYLTMAIGQNLSGLLRGMSWGILIQNNEFHSFKQRMQAIYGFSTLVLKEGASASAEANGSPSKKLTLGFGAFRSSRNIDEASIVLAYTYSPRSALGFGR